MTRVMVWRGSQDLREVEWPPEAVNAVLEGRMKLVLHDITVTEVYAETQLMHFDFYPDSRVPDEALKEIGLEPINKEGR